MVLKVYPYLGEENIAIECSENLLNIIEGNIDEKSIDTLNYGGIVKLSEGEMRTIVKDKSANYLTIKENSEKEFKGADFIRYKTHTQTVWQKSNLEYEVRNYLPKDETGALRCFKKIYYSLPGSKNKSLVHATAVDVNGQGVLFLGKKRSGKTTLAFNMIDNLGASLVEGGSSLISYDNQLIISYLPRPIFARFSTIVDSPYLSVFLEDLKKTESQQPWDIESIIKVIKDKSFDVDGGLNFSRRAFRALSGKSTKTKSVISTIVFSSFSNGSKVKINEVKKEDAYRLLKEREFKIETGIGKLQDQANIENPKDSIIEENWLSGIKLKAISFDGNKDITNNLLEDLLS